jgi:hypothetical protein
MAVQYFAGSANYKSSIINILKKLDELLMAAGWTREYVNPDAAIGGSGGAPGWGKTPAANTTAGYVIYKMPLDGQATAWCVKVEGQWGGNTDNTWLLLITIGSNQLGGVLSNPGTTVTLRPGGNDATEMMIRPLWYLSVYESGFALCIPDAAFDAGVLVGLERKRTIQGQKTDEVTIYGSVGGSSSGTYMLGVADSQNAFGNGVCMTRSAAGEFSRESWLVWKAPGSSSTTCAEPSSMTGSQSGIVLPSGPLLTSGGPGGYARLALIVPSSDVNAGVVLPVAVDGQQRNYIAMPNLRPYNGGGRILIAQQ